jgi:putative DNA primase/helicase
MDNQMDRFSELTGAERSAAILPFPKAQHDDEALISPLPTDAPGLPLAHHKLGKPSGIWPYHDKNGAVLFYVMRFDPLGGQKQFLPLTLWDTPKGLHWHWKGLPGPRPLYRLDELAARPSDPVIVCEGEKAADAAARIFPDHVATCSPNGASAANSADWSPLAGRRVVIWPDADEPGNRYAADVASSLQELECEVSVFNAGALASLSPEGGNCKVKEGWDAADALSEWTNLEALRTAAWACAKLLEPQPLYFSWGDFAMSDTGLWLITEKRTDDDADQQGVWICAPFEILGASRTPNGTGWGKWIRWRDADGRLHTRHLPDADLQRDLRAFCATLADQGLRINRSKQVSLATYLNGASVKGRVTHVDRTGWQKIDDRQVFVLPGQTIGPRLNSRVVCETTVTGPYSVRGSLTDWRNGIGKLASGHFLPKLAISASLAGPLLHLTGQENGGLHFVGLSSTGKTALLQTAASVWGRGSTDDHDAYVRSWRSTANGLEGLASTGSDTALILDEIGVADPRHVAESLYALANGMGKARAGRDGGYRQPKSWRSMLLSSGEVDVTTKLAEDRGRRARAGQLVRLLDIPADRGLGFGTFDHAGPDDDAALLAKSFKQAATSAYGSAGPEFVRRIIAEGTDDIGRTIREMMNEFISQHVPVGADGQITRAAERFALIAAAGELATQFGVTPWKEGEATAAAQWALDQMILRRGGTDPVEVSQAISQVRLFIEQHGESRFESADAPENRTITNRAGWRTGSGPERQWWIPSEVWKSEICQGLDPKFVAKTLCDRGMLLRPRDGFQSVKRIRGGKPTRVYILTADILEGGDDAA